MNRSTLDKLISSTGLIIAIVLLAASGVLFYASSFIHQQVYDNLAPEKIMFPKVTDESFTKLSQDDQAALRPYAGQQLLTGDQAEAFALAGQPKRLVSLPGRHYDAYMGLLSQSIDAALAWFAEHLK